MLPQRRITRTCLASSGWSLRRLARTGVGRLARLLGRSDSLGILTTLVAFSLGFRVLGSKRRSHSCRLHMLLLISPTNCSNPTHPRLLIQLCLLWDDEKKRDWKNEKNWKNKVMNKKRKEKGDKKKRKKGPKGEGCGRRESSESITRGYA